MRRDEGYAYQYAARDQALRQLLVRFWLAPAISRRGCAMMTRVVVGEFAVCFKLMRRGSRPDVARSPSSDGPWGYGALLGNAPGHTVFGVVETYDSRVAPHRCVAHAGTTPWYGEMHLRLPPGTLPWFSADEYFAVRQMWPSLPQASRDRQSLVEREWEAGTCSSQFEFATGRPIRF